MVKRVLVIWFLSLVMTSTQAQEIFVDEETNTRYRIAVVTPAQFPVGMVYAPNGRLFYTEKITGNVRVVLADGTLRREPIINLPTDALQERGMLGIAIDPDFDNNNYLYVVHTRSATPRDFAANRLVRFTVDDNNNVGEVEELFRLPITNGKLLHNGGNVHFDDEGYLYLSIGDYGDAFHAQQPDTPQGALHRFMLTDDGTLEPATGNPYGDDNSIYALGLRNTFDFTFDTRSDFIYGTESGPSCDDELNLIVAGFNYGWREDYACVGRDVITDIRNYAPPMLSFTPTIAPTGIHVYDGEAFPAWQGNVFMCDWNTGTLRRIVLDDTRTRATDVYEIDLGNRQCRLDLLEDSDGALVFGTVERGDGVILKLTPIN